MMSLNAPRVRGAVLFVALIMTIAMAFAAVSLIRGSYISATIGGNLIARQNVALAAFAAIERDVDALYRSGAIASTDADDVANNYYASRAPGEDARGVPRALQQIADYPAAAGLLEAEGALTIRHIVERLCVAPGPATSDNCALSPPSVAAALGSPDPGEPPRSPYFRVSVRVDGPGGATSFSQAMLGAEPAGHRLSWRVLDE
ncbi:MAG TPA: pilus assembly PilX N-terminal domain-containing protein [Casimicrobiaceae bacterium]|nr:pilus assembly PilX N-terminal domain-containing protein [Casimicrobiaceae bacterium]